MNNEELRDALVWLYAVDCELATPVGTEPSLRADCRQAVWDRLVGNETELRVWISRLVRDVLTTYRAVRSSHYKMAYPRNGTDRLAKAKTQRSLTR